MYANGGNYTNVNHTCPYKANETIAYFAERYSGDAFALTYLMPAADYPMNLTYTEGVERFLVYRFEAYFAISHYYRIWH